MKEETVKYSRIPQGKNRLCPAYVFTAMPRIYDVGIFYAQICVQSAAGIRKYAAGMVQGHVRLRRLEELLEKDRRRKK